MWNRFRRYQPDELVTKLNFTIDVGESFFFDAFIFNEIGHIDTMELDITGLTITFTAVDDILTPTLSVSKTVGMGITILDAPSGHLRIELDPIDTLILGVFGGRMYYDVSVADDQGTLYIALRGNLYLRSNAAS